MSKTTAGVIESYAPGKYGTVENLTLKKNKLLTSAKYGDLKLLGKDGGEGWRSEVYKSNVYDRTIRMIAWTGSGRPQGHINITNPRRFEAANDLLSDLNRLQMLRGVDGTKFKRDMVEKFLAAQTDTDRAIALARVETEVMKRLAVNYGVKEVGDVSTMKDAVDQITKWHVGASERRQTLKQYATKNGLIPDEMTGELHVTNFWSPTNDANTIPMLDFRKLEIETILHTNRLSVGPSPIKQGELNMAYLSKGTMALGSFLDTANMVFNNLNLLRFAYIPKNSMVDPFARGTMAMENLDLIGNSLQGTKNIIHNSSLRAESLKRWVPGTAGATARRAEKSTQAEMRLLAKDLNPAVVQLENARVSYTAAEAEWQSARKAQAAAAQAARKATKDGKATAEATAQKAEYRLYEAQKDFYDASDNLDRLQDRVQGLSTVIEKHRKKLTEAAIAQGNLTKFKRLGQEAEIIEVNGKTYSIAGLADPNVRGAKAYMSEVDSATNFYSASMQSEISRRLRAEGSRFVTIKRNEGKAYWNALTHIANRQIRSELDMPLGMMMRGDSDGDVLKWLYTGDAGKEYRRRMSSRAGKDLTRDDYAAWVSETGDKLRKMYPSQELRNVILDRDVTIKEVETILKDRPDLLEEIDGPNINLNDLSRFERGLAGIAGVTDAAWRVLSASETRLVRNPMFLSYTRDELKTLIAAAQRSGIDVTEATVNNQLRQVAYRNALKRVEETLYSSRRLTNGMYVARYAMSFPLAFFNSQTVALRLMAKNPMNAYWYSSIATAFDEFEAYEDQDGNTYKSAADVPPGVSVTVKYPMPLGDKLPGFLKNQLKPYLDPRGGGIKWNPKQMEFMVADPSVSWFGTVGLSEIVKNGFFGDTAWGAYGEDIAKNLRSAFGDDFYENSLLYGGYPAQGGNLITTTIGTMAPGYLQSALDAVGITKSDRWYDEVFNQFRTAYAEWDRNGRIGEPPNMVKAGRAAGNMSFIRSVVQFFAPIATTFDPVTRAATQYYSQLLDENGGDYDAAQKQMEFDWGVDSLAMIGSNQKNVAGVAANYSDIKMIRNNKPLLEKLGRSNPKYAQMLSAGYGDLTDEYSPEIAAIYKKLGYPGSLTTLTTRKTGDEVREEVESKRGWSEYQKAVDWRNAMMYQYAIRSSAEVMYERTGIGSQFDSMIKEIAKDFPGWVTDRNNGRKDFWLQTIPAIKAIANDSKWRKTADAQSPKWAEIQYWITQAEKFRSTMDQTMITDERKFAAKANFAQFHYDFLQGASDEFAAFSSRWLETMPELGIELVID